MRKIKQAAAACVFTFVFLSLPQAALGQAEPAPREESPPRPRNVVLFITDGMRHDSLTADTAPTMFRLREQGVDFANSHSLYPTFTTPNASAFATGHLLGDTGDFGNSLYVGHPISATGAGGTLTPFIENDVLLGRVNEHYDGNYLGEVTVAQAARDKGYAVAVVGKIGPAAIQDGGAIHLLNGALAPTPVIIVDDSTGPHGIPLPTALQDELANLGLSAAAPDRSNGQDPTLRSNNGRSAGTLAPNLVQQNYFANVLTKAILPMFKRDMKPFFVIFWSRDPDGTQHNEADSLNQFIPGINGLTSRAAIRNADNNLWQIVDYLKQNELDSNTDIIVVADHGFSTISKREVSMTGTATQSYSAGKLYPDVKKGDLPPGFLAIDLAHALKKQLYDPDAPPVRNDDQSFYQRVNCECDETKFLQHPSSGNGVIGGAGRIPVGSEITDADVIVAANGGSDLIYLPQTAPQKAESNKQLARQISDFLTQQDYVGGIFVRDDLGEIPGTLPLSAIGLMGSSKVPAPAIVVAFKSFTLKQGSYLDQVEIADTTLQQGQGMHGSFSRADTFNNMLAFGPDFKSGFVDHAPASNADIAQTVAALLKVELPAKGKLRGRVLTESLKTGPASVPSSFLTDKISTPAANGARTLLFFHTLGANTYYDYACLVKTEALVPLCEGM